MKRILSIAIMALLMLALVACESTGQPESNTPAVSQQQQASPTGDITPASVSIESAPTLSPVTTDDKVMVDKLTPEGAVTLASESGSLTLESKLDKDALKEFYQSALQEIGVTETDTMEEVTGWQYMGSYDDGKELTITIIMIGDANNIMITY